jgi:hypothetical protein
MHERLIQQAVQRRFHNHKYELYNSYIFKHDWECDFFSVTDSGYCYEVEVKVSRSDYKADFKKYKHQIFENIKKNNLWVARGQEYSQHYGYSPEYRKETPYGSHMTQDALFAPACRMKVMQSEKIVCPNKFFFAVPEGLIAKEDVPVYAGLIYVREGHSEASVVKDAPFLHKRKLDLSKTLLDKFYWEAKNCRIANQQRA